MRWIAGQRVTASRLSRSTLSATSTVSLSPTTSYADVVGATLTFTTTRPNVEVRVMAVADCGTLGAAPSSTGILVVQLSVDGFGETNTCIWQGEDDDNRNTTFQDWNVVLAAAGSHTLKLRGRRVGGTQGDSSIRSGHTTITAIVEDNV